MNKGERIRKSRERKGATLEELAKACGTTKQTIYKYENNIVTNIPSDRIELMARFLGVSEAYIMGWPDSSADTSPAEQTGDEVLLISRKLNTSNIERLLKYAQALLTAQNAEDEIK